MIEQNDKKFVAFLDILGFKELVLNNKHDVLIDLYQNLFTTAVNNSIISKADFTVENGKDVMHPDFSSIQINSLIVSDSIIIWTDNNSHYSFIQIVKTVKMLMLFCLTNGFPLRGAIVEDYLSVFKSSIGDSVKDNTTSSLVGLALVRAYELESKQDWSGCIIDDTCITRYNQLISSYSGANRLPNLEDLITSNMIAKYNVPFKDGVVKEHYVINWVFSNKDFNITKEHLVTHFSKHKKNIIASVQTKIDNTFNFVGFIQITRKPQIKK